ncbi:MAG: hypothetical protein ACTSQO_05885 [Candidatus Helarchaeota archaeon]
MNDEKRNSVLNKLLDLISGFGQTLINIEQQIEDITQKLSRIEFKIDELSKKEEEVELSIETEYKNLKKNMNASIFTAEELKELDEMEREFQSLDKEPE